MPPQNGATEGLLLSLVVLVLSAFFAYRQWIERAGRELELSEEDAIHFTRKDWRRFLGSIVMTVIALGIFLGTRIDTKASRANARLFGWTWIGVTFLVCVLLILAMLDWLANASYARRHRKALVEERRAFLVEELRRHAALRNGQSDSQTGTI